MDAPFPFGFPAATAFYLALYVATLVVHVVFMNYVLAGSAYLAWFTLTTRSDPAIEKADPLAVPLRDWMPFILSAAITAGIAPLLFVQILYQRSFYTANLLLFNRWMAILPVLIVGFYLLYLLKSRFVAKASVLWRVVVGCGVFACFAFVAFSWTENHLLSLNETVWPEQYISGRWFYRSAELLPRLAVWFAGAWPTMATLVAWQIWYAARHRPGAEDSERGAASTCEESFRIAAGRLRRIALTGISVAAICSIWYVAALEPALRRQLVGPAARWYLVAAIFGLAIQVAGWFSPPTVSFLSAGRLAAISGGALLTIAGTAVLREVRRLAAIDTMLLVDEHADAASVGGLAVFLAFAAINVVLIAWCLWTVRHGLRETAG